MTPSPTLSSCPTLARVPRSAARVIVALAAIACFAPAIVYAQESEGATPDEQPRYEPDQRGAEEEEPLYEPDQRGAQQQPPPYEPDQRGAEGDEEADAGATMQAMPASAELAGESSGSGIGVDLALWLGASVTALDAIGEGNLVRARQEGSFGAALGFSANLRIGQVAFGPRVSMILDPSFVLANLGIGAQYMILPEAFTPFVSASVGGTIVTALGDALPSQREVGIGGIGADVGGGVRWDVTRDLVVGAELSFGWHYLWRDAAPACTTECAEPEFDVRTTGESDALTLRLSLFAGYSF